MPTSKCLLSKCLPNTLLNKIYFILEKQIKSCGKCRTFLNKELLLQAYHISSNICRFSNKHYPSIGVVLLHTQIKISAALTSATPQNPALIRNPTIV